MPFCFQLLVVTKPVAELLKDSSCPGREHCVLSLSVMDDKHRLLGPRNSFFLSSLSRAVGLKDPQLKVCFNYVNSIWVLCFNTTSFHDHFVILQSYRFISFFSISFLVRSFHSILFHFIWFNYFLSIPDNFIPFYNISLHFIFLSFISLLFHKITNIKLTSQGSFSIDVTAIFPAPFVWLSSGPVHGRFSQNGFLQVEPTNKVPYTPY